MIQFYKPNKKVTGTACSFWMNRDKTMMASMIKQDGWNDKTSTGSFAKNKENPNGRVVVKLGNEEIAGIIDVLETNREWSTYHRSSKQKLQIKFCPYIRNGEQVGFSFSVNKQDTEDSTNKVGFIIGFSYPEGRYLKEYLLFLLLVFGKFILLPMLDTVMEICGLKDLYKLRQTMEVIGIQYLNRMQINLMTVIGYTEPLLQM